MWPSLFGWRPAVCRTNRHRRVMDAPRYGIPYWRLVEHWHAADRIVYAVGQRRAVARLALIVRCPLNTARQIGHASIQLGSLLADDDPAVLRATLIGR